VGFRLRAELNFRMPLTVEAKMNGMEYAKENAKRLERIYLTRDVKAQRSETIRQLNLSVGESVLDIGCGPGYLCESMAQIVGHNGAVVGIDISTDLIAVCNRQKASPWISYAIGDATELSQAGASFDVVACTQVAEYVPDVDRLLIEAFRVLKPGGRTIFVATDWDAVVWNSENPERMASVMRSWEAHCAHPHLPRSMASKLVNAGFRLDGASIFPILNLQYDDDSYSKGLAEGIRDFVGCRKDVSADSLNEWHSEFERLSEAGRYFFSTNRYIFRASKPTAQTS
jgi:arsenite methyltransferase